MSEIGAEAGIPATFKQMMFEFLLKMITVATEPRGNIFCQIFRLNCNAFFHFVRANRKKKLLPYGVERLYVRKRRNLDHLFITLFSTLVVVLFLALSCSVIAESPAPLGAVELSSQKARYQSYDRNRVGQPTTQTMARAQKAKDWASVSEIRIPGQPPRTLPPSLSRKTKADNLKHGPRKSKRLQAGQGVNPSQSTKSKPGKSEAQV
ncbi:hypothetical protein C8J56DRAFT_890003 [Mycena floridula]|nr:hypothetical protein C8J56DRAFT_890003 [Mycena floridula]